MPRNVGRYDKVPPRWLHCPQTALHLVSGKFLPFKTPLNSDYDDQIPTECLFRPSTMISLMHSYRKKMRLWIDLTNTNRFYDKAEIESHGISYLKMQCRGHNECPSEEQTRRFVESCHNFISKRSSEIIGIHCTHGFNRTGFLICAYLVERESLSVEAAVREFARARPPGIYKEDYLRELFRRYGRPRDCPPAPTLPDWCTEFDDSVDDDGHTISNNDVKSEDRSRWREREFNRRDPTFMQGISGVRPITSQPKLLQIQRKAQDMCEWNRSGFPGLQPVSMDIDNIKLLQKKPYKVSWKADGTRYMMLIDGKDEVYFLDRDNCVFQVSNLLFPQRKNHDEHLFGTLVDGEMVIDRVDGKAIPNYLIYDIVKYQGLDVGKTDFDRRMLCINRELITPRKTAKENGRIDRNAEPFGVRAKDFWDVEYTERVLGEKFIKQLGHEIDGLIYQPSLEAYSGGRNDEVLKWKPPNLNSIDFKLLVPRRRSETKGLLCVGRNDNIFAKIKLTRELENLDQKIIECKYENNEWKFMRERTDKSFANAYKTAEAVMNTIRNPVTKEWLLECIKNCRGKRPPEDDNYPSNSKRPKV